MFIINIICVKEKRFIGRSIIVYCFFFVLYFIIWGIVDIIYVICLVEKRAARGGFVVCWSVVGGSAVGGAGIGGAGVVNWRLDWGIFSVALKDYCIARFNVIAW